MKIKIILIELNIFNIHILLLLLGRIENFQLLKQYILQYRFHQLNFHQSNESI
jgi:hypothetical protein